VIVFKSRRTGQVVRRVRGRSLRGWDLRGFDLSGADLRGLDFSFADLRGAKLRKANLSGCRFYGARLEGCDLTGRIIDDAACHSTYVPAPPALNVPVQPPSLAPRLLLPRRCRS
jgi:hypothetical protein